MIYSEKLDCGSNSRLVLSGYMVNEYVGNGQVCISECKVLFILQEIVPVSKGNVAPCWFFFIVLQNNILHVFTFVWLLPEWS